MSASATHVLPPFQAPTAAVQVASVFPSPTNPRKHFDKTAGEELLASVRKVGILQPVLVRPWPASRKLPKGWIPKHPTDDIYELVAGERRHRAAQAAGLEEIPALVRDLSDSEVLEIQVIENLQRKDLHALEEAQGYHQLMALEDYDAARIAERIGRSAAYVYDRVKLLNLTKDAQKAFLAGEFTAGHAVILARLKPEDQERAMTDPFGLFENEGFLFTPDEEEKLSDTFEPRKPRSVRELQAWVDLHTKLEAAQVDPMLFPETAGVLEEAAATQEKVVRITYNEMTPEEARDDGQPKIILGRSWKRADGQRGAKECDRSVIGMITIGPGRGQALRVCIDKKRCAVHWGDLIKAAKKREQKVSKAGTTGEAREALRVQEQKREAAEREAEAARRAKAQPAVLAAIAAAVKKAPTGAASTLGQFVLDAWEDGPTFGRRAEAAKHVPLGRTGEDLVRHMAFQLLLADVEEGYVDSAAKTFKALGVNVQKIVDQVAPPPAPARPAKAKTKKR